MRPVSSLRRREIVNLKLEILNTKQTQMFKLKTQNSMTQVLGNQNYLLSFVFWIT
jgi:hypothetical protein